RTKRGRLKIYLGMAAGVGKTFSMLEEAQSEAKRHVDIVIGYLEPHGRAETEAMAAGLPKLPLRTLTHRGIEFTEFDLDGALARHPHTILVDELAHTNQSGSRHTKRWQDVEELLHAGVNVITTVNIQHIESLRDVVAQITGVYVQETVPDVFFELADEIELVDIPPEQLHQRLREGKVYGQEKVDQALDGFFKRSNLLALRELALRHTAEQVDKDLRQSRAGLRQEESWHTAERILVCVAPSKMAPRIVRSAKRLAASLHAELHAVSVESSRQRTITAENREYQEQAMILAERLGAKTAHLAGDDIVTEVINYARQASVTTIVMGKPVRPRWKVLTMGSVVDETLRASGDIDVLVITGAEAQGTPIFRRPEPTRASGRGYLEAVVATAVCTGLGFFITDELHLSNLIMLYLVGVVVVSMRNGIRESLAAAILSVCAFDFLFVPPRFTFAVTDTRYMFTFLVMLAVSVLLSVLTHRLRESSRAVSLRERTTAALFDLSRSLADSRKKVDMAQTTAQKASDLLNCPTAVFVQEEQGLQLMAASTTGFENAPNELAVAAWVADHGQLAGATTDTLAGSRGLYVPLTGSNGTIGALGLELGKGEASELAKKHLIESIASQLAGALERAQFAKDSNVAALQAEAEQMRSNLLSAVSHDLRTPLASIEGSATSLLETHERSESGMELAKTIQDESLRMARLIRNLLDMTRVQGTIDLNLDWQSLDDLISNAVDRTSALFEYEVTITKPSEQILVKVDGVLIEQVIVNLLENAARYGGKKAVVHVELSSSKGFAAFEICDNGPGIVPGDETKIFERFHRGGKSGFGLGLAICKAAVEAHGGQISVRNLHPGAAFRVELPMSEGA
ncbi:MAG: sensor histidine kinase KdpD, partial [Fimbriimonadaceae bacterium]